MAYDNWTVGGISVPHVRTVKNDKPNRTITLSCSALRENCSDGEPRSEIAMFEEMECDVITNTQLINGGSCLQTCNGDPVLVSDGVDTWVAALERVVVSENKISYKRIDYDLVIRYETQGRGISYATSGSTNPDESVNESNEPDDDSISMKRYYRGFCGRSNIEYYQFSDGTNPETPGCATIGKLIINETRKVKTVGISCATLGVNKNTWIEVNGQRYELNSRDWNYITFTLTTPSETITITKDNIADKDSDSFLNSNGVSILYIDLIYEGTT